MHTFRYIIFPLALFTYSHVSVGQDATDSKIRALESRVEKLEAAVAQLSAKSKGLSKAQSAETLNTVQNLSVWRTLKRGMRPEQIRSLLGEPTSIEGGYYGYWYYSKNGMSGPYISFTEEIVSSWKEPK